MLESDSTTQTQLMKIMLIDSTIFWISEENFTIFTDTMPDSTYTILDELTLTGTNQLVNLNGQLISTGVLTGRDTALADNTVIGDTLYNEREPTDPIEPGDPIEPNEPNDPNPNDPSGNITFNYTHFGDVEITQLYYYIHDHLGNTRLVYLPENLDCTDPPHFEYRLEYAADYYPYGKILREYNPEAEKYINTHHERDQETGLTYAGARLLDHDVVRWFSIDPSAVDYPSYSSYSYVLANPSKYIDPDGKDVFVVTWLSKDGESGHAGIAVENYKPVYKTVGSRGGPVQIFMGYEKDGTYTYYDLWPEKSVGDASLQSNVKADYNSKIIYSLDELLYKDPSISGEYGNVSQYGEGRSPDNVIRLSTSLKEDFRIKGTAEKLVTKNSGYNACSNNCSSFVQTVLQSIIPGFDAGQKVIVPYPLNILYEDTYVVAPNNLTNEVGKQNNASVEKGSNIVDALPYLEYFGK